MEKICEWCNENFSTSYPSTKYCHNKHYKKCEFCCNFFLITDMKRPAQCCSRSCSSLLHLKNKKTITKKCEWCQKEFEAKKSSDKYCSEKHFSDCVICGKTFEIISLRRPAKTCSKVCAMKTTDIISRTQKTKETNLEKYGVENISQIDFVKDKKKSTLQNNYHVDNPSLSKEIQEKRKNTFLKKYNTDNPMKVPEFKEKLKKTNLEKYGVDNPRKNKEVQEKIKQITLQKYGVENIFQLPAVQEKAASHSGKRISLLNKKWKKDLKNNLGIDFNFEQLIGDNKLADLGYGNVLIEINPTITHNATTSYVHFIGRCTDPACQKISHAPLKQTYHQERALLAEKNNKILLQYFDWFDKNIFLNIVRSKLLLDENKIGARETVLKKISQTEANKFLKENHLMGASNSQTVCLGLFYDNVLVHVQTYGKSRFNKNFEWEAIRSCSKTNWHIQGAFSKCDQYFFKTFSPKSVVSYVDLSISSGLTETKFDGWDLLNINKPSATWVNLLNNNNPLFIRDSSARRISADRLLGFEVGEKYPRFDKNGVKITNDVVLLSEGYLKIYDCGTKTFVWKKH